MDESAIAAALEAGGIGYGRFIFVCEQWIVYVDGIAQYLLLVHEHDPLLW